MPAATGGGGSVMGGGGAPPGVKTEPMGFVTSVVTNPTLLPLDGVVFVDLTQAQTTAIKTSLLTYSRDVATRQAQAYSELLATISA